MKNFDEIVLKLAESNDSFYIYDEKTIINSITALRNNFSDVEFLYSVKTNPLPAIVDTVVKNGFGFDAASLGEVIIGEKAGLTKNHIYYSAPGKTRADIAAAAEKSVLIADSLNELKIIEEIAAERNTVIEVGIRVNPDFTFDSVRGVSSKFGIDEETVYTNCKWINNLKHIKIIGIHVHSRSQELDSSILEKYYKNMFELCCRIQEKLEIKLQFVNMGGGLGIPYSTDDTPLNVNELGVRTSLLVSEFRSKLDGIKILIETGRYVAGKSGTYVTKVIDKKISYGKTYVILNNTLNGFIRPSLAALVEGYSAGTPKGNEPLYTKPGAFEFRVLNGNTDTETVTLCGNLCTATDVMMRDICLPEINIGDVITVSNAGSYAAVLTPFQFASLTPPAQLFLREDGTVI